MTAEIVSEEQYLELRKNKALSDIKDEKVNAIDELGPGAELEVYIKRKLQPPRGLARGVNISEEEYHGAVWNALGVFGFKGNPYTMSSTEHPSGLVEVTQYFNSDSHPNLHLTISNFFKDGEPYRAEYLVAKSAKPKVITSPDRKLARGKLMVIK